MCCKVIGVDITIVDADFAVSATTGKPMLTTVQRLTRLSLLHWGRKTASLLNRFHQEPAKSVVGRQTQRDLQRLTLEKRTPAIPPVVASLVPFNQR
jgi:hypothetical protein